jgi:hypothetical protein
MNLKFDALGINWFGVTLYIKAILDLFLFTVILSNRRCSFLPFKGMLLSSILKVIILFKFLIKDNLKIISGWHMAGTWQAQFILFIA